MDQLLKKVISLREEVDQIIELIEKNRAEEGEIKDNSGGKKRQREEQEEEEDVSIFFKKRKDRMGNITEEEMRSLFRQHKIEYRGVTVYKGVYGIASFKKSRDVDYCLDNKDQFSKDSGIIFEEYVRGGGGGKDKKNTNI